MNAQLRRAAQSLIGAAIVAALWACSSSEHLPAQAEVPPAATKPTQTNAMVPKEIVNIAWTDSQFTQQLTSAVTCQDIGILVTTRGYAPGEDIHITVGVSKSKNTERDVKLHGKVDADGKARVPWPAMGCNDHAPTSLHNSVVEKPEVERASTPAHQPDRPVQTKPSSYYKSHPPTVNDSAMPQLPTLHKPAVRSGADE